MPCGKDLGGKEPFDDPSQTTGLCDECRAIIEAEFLRAYPDLLRQLSKEEGHA